MLQHPGPLLSRTYRGEGQFSHAGPSRMGGPSLCLGNGPCLTSESAALFSYADFLAVVVAQGHFFYSVNDIPHPCKGQAFNRPSAYGLLMVYHVPGNTISTITF